MSITGMYGLNLHFMPFNWILCWLTISLSSSGTVLYIQCTRYISNRNWIPFVKAEKIFEGIVIWVQDRDKYMYGLEFGQLGEKSRIADRVLLFLCGIGNHDLQRKACLCYYWVSLKVKIRARGILGNVWRIIEVLADYPKLCGNMTVDPLLIWVQKTFYSEKSPIYMNGNSLSMSLETTKHLCALEDLPQTSQYVTSYGYFIS